MEKSMKMTSAQAGKLLRQLQEEYSALLEKERISREFVAAVGEDVESVRPAYDYAAAQSALQAVEKKIRTLKHALNVFNTTHIVPGFDMTVDELLVYLPQLSGRVNKLAQMKAKLPKQRVEERYGKSSNIIDYTYVNYDLGTVEADYEAAREELSRAQLALDAVNTSEVFEVTV